MKWSVLASGVLVAAAILFSNRYKLMRSRARDPRDITHGGYHLVDHQVGGVAFGYGNAGRCYAANLDDVEAWLNGDDWRGLPLGKGGKQKTELEQRSRR